MELRILESDTHSIAEVLSDKIEITCMQDSLDLMGNADYQGARRIIIHEKNLDPAFFKLASGLAGEILQKYSNYRMKLAIIGDFGKYGSKSLNAFIIECNRGSHIYFVPDLESAKKKLLQR